MSPITTIRARNHEGAIPRGTRAFAVGLADIFTETLQNARRAGAGGVAVALSRADGALAITVTDDGDGIADPGVLLSFGETGWSDALMRNEHAGGTGLMCFGRRGCTIESRPRSLSGEQAPGWRVALARTHFLGETHAEVHRADDAPYPHGTAVTFGACAREDGAHIRRALERAARHAPLRVVFEDGANTAPGGGTLERSGFLDEAIHVERWRGVVFGVYKTDANRVLARDPDMNIHGRTVEAALPAVFAMSGAHWSARADIERCPELKLAPTKRKVPAETEVVEEIREAARRAIYRAMAADPDPRPCFADYARAQRCAIHIAAAPPELAPWRPGVADLYDAREPPAPTALGPGAMLMTCDLEAFEAQTLWRAAERRPGSGLASKLFEPDPRLEGYAWYDALARVRAIEARAGFDGCAHALVNYPIGEATGALGAPPGTRPEWIAITVHIHFPARTGGKGRLELNTDVAFVGETGDRARDVHPLVTTDSALTPEELMALMRAGFFSPSQDADAEPSERQRTIFEREALHVANRLLISGDTARCEAIAEAVASAVLWLIPHDRGADIAVRHGEVTVTLGPHHAPAPPAARMRTADPSATNGDAPHDSKE